VDKTKEIIAELRRSYAIELETIQNYLANSIGLEGADAEVVRESLEEQIPLKLKRARRLANGAEATVEWENDKPTVVALREIAAGNITLEMLEEPEEPVQQPAELEMPSDFRAPQLGLGD